MARGSARARRGREAAGCAIDNPLTFTPPLSVDTQSDIQCRLLGIADDVAGVDPLDDGNPAEIGVLVEERVAVVGFHASRGTVGEACVAQPGRAEVRFGPPGALPRCLRMPNPRGDGRPEPLGASGRVTKGEAAACRADRG